MPLAWHIAAIAVGALGLAITIIALTHDRAKGRRRCPKCWYDMTSISGLRCPECGRDARRESHLAKTRPNRRLAAIGLTILLSSLVLWKTPRIREDWTSVVPGPLLVLALQVWGDPPDIVEQRIVTRVQSGTATRWDRLQAASWAKAELPNAIDAYLALDPSDQEEDEPDIRASFFMLRTRTTAPSSESFHLQFVLGTLARCQGQSRIASTTLISYFEHEHPYVRQSCIRAAGTHGADGGAFVDALIRATHSPDLRTIFAAVESLAAIGPPARKAIPRLIELPAEIRTFDEDELQEAAMNGRASNPHHAVAAIIDDDPRLWRTMLEHPSESLRSLAIAHVQDVRGADAAYIAALRAVLTDHETPWTANSIKGLGKLQPTEVIIPLLIELLDFDTVAARTMAVQVLRAHPDFADQAFDPLVALLEVEQDPITGVVCAHAVAELARGSPEAPRALAARLTSESPEIAIAAAVALASLGADASSALPALRAAAENEREIVARAAAQAINRIESAIASQQ
jgi:HEAT repeat protein